MFARKFLSAVAYTFIVLLLISPYFGCDSSSSSRKKVVEGPTPNLWVDIDNDTNATIGDEGVGSKADPFDGINYALSFAAAGDVIGVADGTYDENVVMEDSVDIFGGYTSSFGSRDPDANVAVIDGGGVDAVLGADDATIDGFTITGGGDGVNIDGVDTTVSNNVIAGNSSFGVDLYGGSPTISNNYIYSNGNRGLYIGNYGASETSFPSVTNNIISYNSDGGLEIYGYSVYPIAPTISNNIINYNSNEGVYVYADRYSDLLLPTISNNEIDGNSGDGVLMYAWYEGQIQADIISNKIMANAGSGIFAYAYTSTEGSPAYQNFPAISLVIANNDISENTDEGIYLLNYAESEYYSKLDTVISNNIIRANEEEGIYIAGWSDTDYGASVTTNKITNNLISANKDSGIYAYAYASDDYAGGFIGNELANNLIIGNDGDGVYAYSYIYDSASIFSSIHSVNDVVVGNEDDGIDVGAYGSDYGVATAVATLDNLIARDNYDDDIDSSDGPGGTEQTAINTNFSNIGDGDTNGDGVVDEGDDINGNISEDPLFVNAPVFYDWATGTGTTTTALVLDESLYAITEVIEIGDDGVARTVTGGAAGSITFTPALPFATTSGDNIRNFGIGGSVIEDFSLLAGSPSIDAGNPLLRYLDGDETRNDQGLKGGPLGGEPGTSDVVGIDPELGTPGPQ